MNIASNILGGGTFNAHDPCVNTWVNFSSMPLAITFSPNIFFAGGNAVFLASVLATSQGDIVDLILFLWEPTLGPVFMQDGIPTILLNGIPAVAMMTETLGNATNADQGGVAIPSPCNVLMYFDHDGSGQPPTGRVSNEAVTAIGNTLARSGDALRTELVGTTGHIHIEVFGWGIAAALRGALTELEARGAADIVIDLRQNPGGDVLAAVEAAGHFLEEGSVIATLVDSDGDETIYRARAGERCGLPLRILVDGQTASAAELFTNALRDHDRATIEGPPTLGKTFAHRIVPAVDRGGAWDACARVLSPSESR